MVVDLTSLYCCVPPSIICPQARRLLPLAIFVNHKAFFGEINYVPNSVRNALSCAAGICP